MLAIIWFYNLPTKKKTFSYALHQSLSLSFWDNQKVFDDNNVSFWPYKMSSHFFVAPVTDVEQNTQTTFTYLIPWDCEYVAVELWSSFATGILQRGRGQNCCLKIMNILYFVSSFWNVSINLQRSSLFLVLAEYKSGVILTAEWVDTKRKQTIKLETIWPDYNNPIFKRKAGAVIYQGFCIIR